MTDLLFPTWARVSSVQTDIVSNTAASRSIFTGKVNSVGQSGDRFRFGVRVNNANRRETDPIKSALQSLRAGARGQANRIWFSDPSYVQRGSFPSSELFANNSFDNGVVGWSAINNAAISVSDRVLRLSATAVVSGTYPTFRRQTVSAAYSPHVVRSIILDGDQSYGLQVGPIIGDGTGTGNTDSNFTTSRGLIKISCVARSASLDYQYPAIINASSGYTAGACVYVPWCSHSRCMQVDNASNLLLYSQQFDNAAWTKFNCTITANVAASPDGTTSADRIVEDGSSGIHGVYQSVSVAAGVGDYAFTVAVQADIRGYCWLQLYEATGATAVLAVFKLDGTLGSTTSVGGNWSDLRTFMRPMGSGWYACTLIARKTNGATTVRAYVAATPADNANNYTGSGTGGVYLSSAVLALSGVPTRMSLTTSAASSGSLQTGPWLYVKGLPASTTGLLLSGDRVQIGNQLNIVTASLDSDAAGLGYLQCAIPWRTSPADNDPVIVNNPMARCILTENTGGWSESPGGFSDFDFVFEEACE